MRRNAEGAIPPGNAQAHERQTAVRTAGLLESGASGAFAQDRPPKGSGAGGA
jgi:hypothetical protein